MHESEQQQQFDKIPNSIQPINKKSELMTSSEETFEIYTTTTTADYQTSVPDVDVASSDIYAHVATVLPWELIQQNADLEKQIVASAYRPHAMPIVSAQKLTAISFRADEVRVVIHNITQLTEDDVQQRGHLADPTIRDNLYDEDINEKL